MRRRATAPKAMQAGRAIQSSIRKGFCGRNASARFAAANPTNTFDQAVRLIPFLQDGNFSAAKARTGHACVAVPLLC